MSDAMTEVKVLADGFMLEAGLIATALGIDEASVPARMRSGEITSRCETGIDEDAGRFRLTLYSEDRAARFTVDQEGNVLLRATFPAPRQRMRRRPA